MKQYLTKEQTQHLIELGFPHTHIIDIEGFLPEDMVKYYASGKDDYNNIVCYDNYSIGELIAFLPFINLSIYFSEQKMEFCINYGINEFSWHNKELVNVLYDACVELKNKGEI